MKKQFLPLFFGLMSVFLWQGCTPKAPRELKVMSFNIWVGGGKSLDATTRVIRESGADIVGIQESKRDRINKALEIADSLGWYGYEGKGGNAILSRFAAVDTSAAGYGVKFQIAKNQFVWMFNIHLMYCPYEPYQLNGISYCGAPLLSTAEEAVASARNTRGEEVAVVIKDIQSIQREGYPIFLTGDFNEPSWLDWTADAAGTGLCIMPVQWPTTKNLMEGASLKDSYRTIYPDPVTQPGHTWTPHPDIDPGQEVHDRIDFLLFGGNIRVLDSFILGEDSEKSDIRFADYPSDHRAVLSVFQFN